MNQRIFISSVQREFAKERRALAEMIRKDMLLGTFFDVFLFEEMAAQNRSAKSVYLDEVRNSDIYLGLFGCEYGFEDAEGVSPTEREYDLATECGKYRLAFVKRTAAHNRMPKERTLIAKVEREVTRKSFSSLAMLKKMVYEALFRYLQDRDVVNVRPFDGSYSLGVKLEDLDPERIANFVRMVRVAGKVTFAPGISTTEILSRLGAFDAGTGKIANAAALLFAKNPALFRPSWELKCLQLWGTTFEKPFPSYHIYHGTVFEQIDQALDFVMSRVDHWVGARDAAKSAQAPARSEFPIEAVREAIVNAVCHRDYTDDGSVQVMLFRDRLEVLNPERCRVAGRRRTCCRPTTRNPITASSRRRCNGRDMSRNPATAQKTSCGNVRRGVCAYPNTTRRQSISVLCCGGRKSRSPATPLRGVESQAEEGWSQVSQWGWSQTKKNL